MRLIRATLKQPAAQQDHEHHGCFSLRCSPSSTQSAMRLIQWTDAFLSASIAFTVASRS